MLFNEVKRQALKTHNHSIISHEKVDVIINETLRDEYCFDTMS